MNLDRSIVIDIVPNQIECVPVCLPVELKCERELRKQWVGINSKKAAHGLAIFSPWLISERERFLCI